LTEITAAAATSQEPGEDRPLRAGALLTTCHPRHWTQTQVFDYTTEMALAAEDLGYDCVWVLEHHFTPYGLCPNTFSMAGYLLGRTSRIRVGSAIAVAPLEHPVRIAEQVCLLDQLSHGRFIAGFGRGHFPKDFEAFGIDPAESAIRLQEWVAILKQACCKRTIGWDSALIKLPDAVPFPEPFTKPHPPIYTVAGSPSTVEWAASLGLPMLMSITVQLETLRSSVELYNETARAFGHDPSHVEHVVAIIAHVADSAETAYDELIDNLVWWNQEGRDAALTIDMLRQLPNYRYHYTEIQAAIHRGDRDLNAGVRRMMDRSAVGTPDQCIERLRTIREATGIRNFAFGFEGVLDRDRILDTMRRFASEVLPYA